MNTPTKAEVVYSIKDDLQGKYLEHGLKIGDVVNNVSKLYYIKVQEVYVKNMPEKELLHFSHMIDCELNRRYGTGEFKVIKDIKDVDVQPKER